MFPVLTIIDKYHKNVYFWRTYQQQEIDMIEEHDGKLFGVCITRERIQRLECF
jgi:hypothetical protein